MKDEIIYGPRDIERILRLAHLTKTPDGKVLLSTVDCTLPVKKEDEIIYSHNAVKRLLCEGCFYGLSIISEDGVDYHYVSGIKIPCIASNFARASVQSKQYKEIENNG